MPARRDGAATMAAAEKRLEPRQQADGPVALQPRDRTLRAEIAGELVDISSSGFRARHGCRSFYTGLEVDFRHTFAAGRARVVWNRITGPDVESGFLILAS